MDRRSFLLSVLAAIPAGKLFERALVHPGLSPLFEDVTAKSGIRLKHQPSRSGQKYLPESMGAGVAMLEAQPA